MENQDFPKIQISCPRELEARARAYYERFNETVAARSALWSRVVCRIIEAGLDVLEKELPKQR